MTRRNNRRVIDPASYQRYNALVGAVTGLLAGYRDHPPARIDAVCDVLVAVSQMLADLPELAELDINPLLADADGVVALDARMRVARAAGYHLLVSGSHSDPQETAAVLRANCTNVAVGLRRRSRRVSYQMRPAFSHAKPPRSTAAW